MSPPPKKGVVSEQLRQAAKDLNLTVAAIAEGTGLSKAYISEFRNETRNLSPSQQAQLRTYLEAQYQAQGQEFPEVEDSSPKNLMEGLGGMIQRISRPAILLSDDLPKAQAEKLLDLIEANRVKLTGILSNDFETGGFLGGDFSDATDDAIRQVFALAGLNYIAILMLQGRNIVRKVPSDASPATIGDWLSGYLAQSPLADLIPDGDAVGQVEPDETESEDL
jgi:transcriptional regulator with XRE-family HTH domain